ncbi:amino acid adenylation domain-containing protein [Vogesella facilis]|uniref:Amino acid adenylation domain-containing protein n=1 Tax=Vogesella facilis TaxID=1655232 RepID=A0ABV7RA82_9NEIS
MNNIKLQERSITAGNGKAFWQSVMLDSGFTAIPRWTLDTTADIDEYEIAIPAELMTAVHQLATALSLPLSVALLSAHAKVLGALSGEQEVTIGYAQGGSSPLPLPLSLAARTWRELLQYTAQAEATLLEYQNFPVAELQRELGLTAPLFEAELAIDSEGNRGLAASTVLAVGFAQSPHTPPPDGYVLQLRYRTDVLDDACAARIAGYHLTALALMTAAPDAAHASQTLLSAEELHYQFDGFAGPHRELPDGAMHELFEKQALIHPDTIAVMHGNQQLTYRQLNARANRLARTLLTQGLRREGVVAVVCERNLDWITAVFAIFKAGGAYLPIEPHFPADRMARMLTRADCHFVLTEQDSCATLDPLLDTPAMRQLEIQRLFIGPASTEAGLIADLGIGTSADQLAYIYFTSGSTGEPKGAMCEHAGLVNHLFAKIDDLQIGAGSVVAQTAPQCFDISLWQLVAALLVGGHTQLIEQEVILDTKRFVDKLVDAKVNVLQVVPSYLEVVLSYLEAQPRALPDLRYVAVTGEALKKELTQRWFAALPEIKLVNAYGLTETSDDTNHEIMDRVPSRERVPLGRAVNNVHVYVVDEQLSPVPLGAPGEIVFSGVCVGRGYINDPERTQHAFMPDPHHPGQRLYRSGDFGRWLPEGKLEYLGRRDAQLKIRGFRIELGEIENSLLRLPGVRDGAVVAVDRVGRGKQLVAFYAGEQALAPTTLQQQLGESLPQYMIPSAFHWQPKLPLTDNGKIDKRTLAAYASETDLAKPNHGQSRTPTEQQLACAWAEILCIPPQQIGPDAHFFELGGTSLSALQLVTQLNRAISVKELAAHPVLANLAHLIDTRAR